MNIYVLLNIDLDLIDLKLKKYVDKILIELNIFVGYVIVGIFSMYMLLILNIRIMVNDK